MTKLLIVDDNEQNLLILQEILGSHNYDVITASNGAEALKKARQDPPDIIVSDLLMPVMDGFTLCHEWKRDDLLNKIPFVVYSSEYTDEKDKDLALKLGVNRFVRKPIEPDKFMRIMQSIVEDISLGNQGATKLLLEDDVQSSDVFKLYNERLINKLEQKMIDLAQEVAERKRTEMALKESENQLRALASRIEEVGEHERKSLAKELHDKVGPNLTSLSINLSIIKDSLSNDLTEEVSSRVSDSLALVEETAEFIRDVMSELRPQVLDDYGLISALRWYIETFQERTGTSVEFHGEELTTRLSHEMETALFRIAQEAMTNVAKHARAGRIIVTFEEILNLVRMTIVDNGKGFNITGLAPNKRPGWGLVNMRERTQALGGDFLIESGPGEGTRVVIQVKR